MNKAKTKITLENGEAYVILPIERWDHIIFTYRTLAERLDTEEDKQAWRDLADDVELWVTDTLYQTEDQEEFEDGWA